MAYTINKTDGTIFATVQDGTIDNSTSSLVLVGKNYAGWGEALDENFVKLLESHANPTAPTTPHLGQLWFDSSQGILTVYDGSAFKPLAASTPTDSQPTESVTGDMWFDTINSQLNIYDGSNFIVVGPSFTDSGTTGALTETMTDTLSVVHTVIKQYIDSEVVAVISKDAAFVPIGVDQIPGFGSTIFPGIQLAETLTGQLPVFTGTASDSDRLGGELPAAYLRSDEADETTGALSIKNDSGLTVGALSEGTFGIVTGDVIISNQTTADIILRSGATDVITIDGTDTIARVATPPGTNILDIANVDYVDTEISNLPALTATNTTITDAGTYYTSGHTEGALQEVGADIVTINSTKGDIDGQTFTNATLATTTIGVTQAAGDNTTKLATTAFVTTASINPCFRAYRTSSYTAGVGAVIQFNAETFDVTNAYSTGTYRFTPLVAGIYLITSSIHISAHVSIGVLGDFRIRKNAGIIARSGEWNNSSGDDASYVITTLVELNGSTDYVDVVSSTADGIVGGTSETWFQGHMVQPL